jgi:hypothetical protein
MPFTFTPLMKKRLTPRVYGMLIRALRHFPELQDKPITVGYTRAHLGSAVLSYRPGREPRLIIRLKVRKLTYQTLGHELTHLLQGLIRGDRRTPTAIPRDKIPAGEKQCDIWTLARHELFCDDAPTYIKMPRRIREDWPRFADAVRSLCVAAIDKRHTHRQYIRWLEEEIRKLAQSPRLEKPAAPAQLPLPF